MLLPTLMLRRMPMLRHIRILYFAGTDHVDDPDTVPCSTTIHHILQECSTFFRHHLRLRCFSTMGFQPSLIYKGYLCWLRLGWLNQVYIIYMRGISDTSIHRLDVIYIYIYIYTSTSFSQPSLSQHSKSPDMIPSISLSLSR